MTRNPASPLEPYGLELPAILLPSDEADLSKWPVIACDQFTSEPEYWENLERSIGAAPSTLHCILPECRLGKPDEEARIAKIRETITAYLDAGVVRETGPGVVLVERKTSFGRVRRGMVAALDLEKYDFRKGSRSLIRPTEGTILERLPPRIRVRKGSPAEFPHILILIDDPEKTVVEPLFRTAEGRKSTYSADLPSGGGSVRGWYLEAAGVEADLERGLRGLADRKAFKAKYDTEEVLLFAVGDGNHSLATAKAVWEDLKPGLGPEERENHPARYALAEIVNLYDPGIVFEPIHRVLFSLSYDDFRRETKARGAEVREIPMEAAKKEAGTRPQGKAFLHAVPFRSGGTTGILGLRSASSLAAEAVEGLLSDLQKTCPEAKIDYIHGEESLLALSSGTKALGLELPPFAKESLFPTVIRNGVLPKKAFSIGEAQEKRYYFEGRRIR